MIGLNGRRLAAVWLGVAVAAAAWGVGPVLAQQDVEAPPVLNAAAILPAALLAGPRHRVAEAVWNDGYQNHYVIKSDFGEFTAVSTPKLYKRLDEIAALAKLEQISRTDVFAKAFEDAGRAGIEGVKNLVFDPVGSVSGAVSGVGKIFGRIGEGTRSARSGAEDGRLASILGISTMKRAYAAELGVDPYTDNQVLQARLDEIARTAFLGDLGPKAAISAIPGGAGVALSVSQNAYELNDLLRRSAPVDLRKRNREKLLAMGVQPVVADLFIDNAVYTPTDQTLLVDALDRMDGAAGREVFVRFAVLANDVDVTYFRQRQAAMYAGFHATVARIARFVPVGQLAAAELVDGALLFVMPLDYLAWTAGMRDYIANGSAFIDQTLKPTAKQVWIGGSATPLARDRLAALGWRVTTDAGAKLMPGFRY